MLMDTGRRKLPVNPQDPDTLALGLFYLNNEKIYFYHLCLLITEAKLYQDDKPVTIIVADAGSHIIP